MNKNAALFLTARKQFHNRLISEGILSVDSEGIATNADRGNAPSREIAKLVALRLDAEQGVKQRGQTAGANFEQCVRDFVFSTFTKLNSIRPGKWDVVKLGNRSRITTADFSQYEHLHALQLAVEKDPQLAASLGNGYLVAPDIIVSRGLCDDEEINNPDIYVDDNVCLKADLRKKNGGAPILHASISVKWTIRSDRAQNSRTESLNLVRDRKGRLPHIVVVTGETLPSRLMSLALGTGDIDCVYHFALYELIQAVKEYGKNGREDIIEQLDTLVNGRRLKDISDLPLDLAC